MLFVSLFMGSLIHAGMNKIEFIEFICSNSSIKNHIACIKFTQAVLFENLTETPLIKPVSCPATCSAKALCAASCLCDLPVCECCPECAVCLGELYIECCDCFLPEQYCHY